MFDGLEPIEPIAIGFFPSTDWLLSFSTPELKKPSPPYVEISALALSNEAKNPLFDVHKLFSICGIGGGAPFGLYIRPTE